MVKSGGMRLLVAITVLMAVAVGVQIQRDRVYADTATPNQDVLYFNSGKAVGKLALSYDALVADMYWIRALQHYGYSRLHPQEAGHYELLYPFLDLTTSLDPNFMVAYRFGAIFLAEPYPGGAGRPDAAVKLLQKGAAALPARWEFFHDIGFVYYWHLHDYKHAAEWFERGAELPGSPWWLRTYAAAMLSRGGDRRASRAMWQNIFQMADNEWLKQNALLRLTQLDALDQIDLLGRARDEFVRRRGRLPESWQELAAAGSLRSEPLDPTGAPYTLNFATGEINVSGYSKLSPLPTEPAAAPDLNRSLTPR
jgi:hypothetical protein